jgi:hypothetical protein
MAITGTFLADFVQFEGATKSAEGTLRSLEASSVKVEAQLVRMTGASTRGAGASQQWTGQLRQFDGVLASMGINIGTEIRGLEDMASASGKTAAQLGGVATAGLAFGAAIGGWKIGRLVADFFDLDKAIGNTTAKLLGWGDVSAEVLGAQQDTKNKAISLGADEQIEYAAAIQFTRNAIKQLGEDNALTLFRTHLDIAGAAAAALSEQEKVLIHDAVALNLSTADIATGMHLTEGAVSLYAESLKKLAADEKAAAAVQTEQLAVTTKLWAEYYTLVVGQSGTATDVQIANVWAWYDAQVDAAKKAGTATQGFYDALGAQAEERIAAIGSKWGELAAQSREAAQQAADAAKADYDRMMASGLTFSQDVLDAQLQKWRDLQQAADNYGFAGVEANEKIAAAVEHKNAAEAKPEKEKAEKKNAEPLSYTQTYESAAEVRAAKGLLPGVTDQLLKYFADKEADKGKADTDTLLPSGTPPSPTTKGAVTRPVSPSITVPVTVYVASGSPDVVAREVQAALVRDQKFKRLLGGG